MDKKKRLKRIEGLEKQKEIHREKIRSHSGKKSYLLDYWEKEISRFDAEILEEKRKLRSK